MSFRRNSRLAGQLARDPRYRLMIRAQAEVAAKYAETFARQARAPWMKRKGAQGTIEVTQDGDRTLIVNTDHAGHLQEWGSVNNPAHAPLRRGVRAAGFRLREQSKQDPK